MEENPDALAMMFLLDIDNFKKINDTLGHAFGDEVLRTFGRTIGSIFRVTDIIGRTGGDEFTIFLKFLKSDENTLKEAEKLVKFFEGFQAGEYVKYSATASIGAAVFPADGENFDALYKAADTALYKAKKRGKNQLAFYDDRDRKGKEE
ncbi:MAG: GGDEF domain-containing protein [Lachnospiraceae bacterium]|nr:GGDEF domain-containing protein [Lachnospiraceae bacterium]